MLADYGDKEIELDKLQAAIVEYAQTIRQEYPRIFNVLNNCEPVLSEDLVLELGFQNEGLKEDFLLKVKPAFLDYVRQKVRNSKLELSEKIVEAGETSNKKLYSDTDKLQHMMDKNPALKDLKQEFNLDFD